MCQGSGHLLAKGNSGSEPSSSVVPMLIMVMLGGGVDVPEIKGGHLGADGDAVPGGLRSGWQQNPGILARREHSCPCCVLPMLPRM